MVAPGNLLIWFRWMRWCWNAKSLFCTSVPLALLTIPLVFDGELRPGFCVNLPGHRPPPLLLILLRCSLWESSHAASLCTVLIPCGGIQKSHLGIVAIPLRTAARTPPTIDNTPLLKGDPCLSFCGCLPFQYYFAFIQSNSQWNQTATSGLGWGRHCGAPVSLRG